MQVIKLADQLKELARPTPAPRFVSAWGTTLRQKILLEGGYC